MWKQHSLKSAAIRQPGLSTYIIQPPHQTTSRVCLWAPSPPQQHYNDIMAWSPVQHQKIDVPTLSTSAALRIPGSELRVIEASCLMPLPAAAHAALQVTPTNCCFGPHSPMALLS
jgi:hypothetical protein